MSERAQIARRLMAMQGTLRGVMDACEAQSAMCMDAGASGLALAVLMVRESIDVYRIELAKFVVEYLKEDREDGEEEDEDEE